MNRYSYMNIWTYEQLFICETFHKCKVFHCSIFHKCKWVSLSCEQLNIWTTEHMSKYSYVKIFTMKMVTKNFVKKFTNVNEFHYHMNNWTYEHMNRYSYVKNFTNVNENAYQLQLWKNSQSFITFIVKNSTMKVNPAYICEIFHNESILHESDIHASAYRNPFHCEKIHEKNRNSFHCEKIHNERQIICKRLHCEKIHNVSVFTSNCWKRFHMWNISQV